MSKNTTRPSRQRSAVLKERERAANLCDARLRTFDETLVQELTLFGESHRTERMRILGDLARSLARQIREGVEP